MESLNCYDIHPRFFVNSELHIIFFKVPERVLRTVRVSVASNEQERHGGSRVRIGILVCGSQEGFEHVRRVTTRNYIFTENDQVIEVWRISNTRLGCVTSTPSFCHLFEQNVQIK